MRREMESRSSKADWDHVKKGGSGHKVPLERWCHDLDLNHLESLLPLLKGRRGGCAHHLHSVKNLSPPISVTSYGAREKGQNVILETRQWTLCPNWWQDLNTDCWSDHCGKSGLEVSDIGSAWWGRACRQTSHSPAVLQMWHVAAVSCGRTGSILMTNDSNAQCDVTLK